MYGGWPGPPSILRYFIRADGEAAYDLVQLDMFLAVSVLAFPLVLWFLGRVSLRVKHLGSLAGAVLYLGPAILLGGEAVHIGLLAGPGAVAEYRFGSESMVGHGGWAYRSRLTYFAHGVLWSIGLAVVGVFLASTAQRARQDAEAERAMPGR